jgi:hypothetical protein
MLTNSPEIMAGQPLPGDEEEKPLDVEEMVE